MKLRLFLVGIVAILVAAWLVSKVSAGRFRQPILQALESAVGRKVEIGDVRFRLLPTPGLMIENVRISEDPAIGLEPVAYINTVRAVPRISALFGGPMSFYSVDLDEASVNITRVEEGSAGVQWNLSSLMRPALLQTVPSIHMTGGRVNFKLGQTKSTFYLLNTDADLWPPTHEGGSWAFRIRTEPARTDRPARGIASFTGRGEWIEKTGAVTMDLRLARTQMGELLTLFQGHDTGVRGQISAEAHFAGPLTRVGVRGRLSIADVHSWELTSQSHISWPVSVSGAINIPGQVIELRATGDNAPIDIRYRIASLWGRPQWGAMAYFEKLPLAPLVGIARNLGAAIPSDMQLMGSVEGAVGYSTGGGPPKLDGQVQLAQTTLGMPGTPPLRIDVAHVEFADTSAKLGPTELRNEQGETATLTGSYDLAAGKFEAGVSSLGMDIASLRKQISVAGAPVLSQATSGQWSGNLLYRDGWSGDFHLQDAVLPFEAFSEPVRIVSADALLNNSDLAIHKMSLRLGKLEAAGDYSYETKAIRPHKFRLAVHEADAALLESLLMPTLKRGNLLTYAFTFTGGRAPQPDWLSNMRADGTLTFSTLRMMDLLLSKVRTRVIWDGTQLRFPALQATLDDASLSGTGTADLSRRKPDYRFAGHITGMPWRSGVMAGDGELETSGTGSDLLSALVVKGSFHGKNLDFSPFEVYSAADGCFEWAWDARNPKLKLTQLALQSDEGTFVGSGETQDDGQMLLHLQDGAKQVQAAGSLWKGGALRSVGQ